MTAAAGEGSGAATSPAMWSGSISEPRLPPCDLGDSDDDGILGTGSASYDDPIFQCSGGAFLEGQLGNLSNLQYLNLSNTGMHSSDVSWIAHLPRLRITNLGKLYNLNLAGNGLSGAIPCHLSNLTAMAGNGENDDSGDQDWYFDGSLSLLPVTTKGQELYYYFALSSMVNIDLSSNYLTGGIPEEMT
ncbi:unnamed protein product [Miscanthus lutarioriparius]|uniref:Uncharacterized protein n=1 Tax=Miscanthus lutarioriparius TaxID=422564 RepID=A0A811S4L7_9POAL|nr:unnamed protein product [Miscanthus lutarioriparius]